jgi:outer membrane protein TolC
MNPRRPSLNSKGVITNITVFLGAFLFNAASSRAQELPAASAPTSTITEAQAIRKAVKNSKELTALESAVKAQQPRVDCTWCTLRNPELRIGDISTNYFYYPYPDVKKQLQVGLRWHFPKLGEIGIRQQREKVLLWKNKAKAEKYRLRLVADVRQTYAEAAMLKQYNDLAIQASGLEERYVSSIDRLVELGQKTVLDKIKARRRLMKTRRDASKAQQRYTDLKSKLAALTGEKGDLAVLPIDPPENAPNINRLHERALAHRAEVRLTEQKVKLTEQRYDAARYRLIPWFSFVEFDYHYDSINLDWGEVRFGIEIPLFNFNTGEIDATAVAVEAHDDTEAATTEFLDREISDAVAKYNKALADWRSLKTETDEFLPKTEALIKQAKAQPSVPIDELIDLELSVIEVKQMALEAGLALNEAAIGLCKAVGVDRWEDIGK